VVPDQVIYDDHKGWQVYVTGVQVQIAISPCFAKPAKADGKKTSSTKSDPGKKGKKAKKQEKKRKKAKQVKKGKK